MANHGGNLENDLASFRQHWHAEIKVVKENKLQNVCNDDEGNIISVDVEERATQLFLEGVRYEKEGQFNAAVYYYRQAVHLVPDIEFKIYQKSSSVFNSDDDDDSEDEDIDQNEEYEDCFQLDTLTVGLFHATALCSSNAPQMVTHISALPTELLMSLFKWVVSKDLDVKSLGRLSLVCKWFYACARDEEIWKKICLRMWGINCVNTVVLYKNCWKRLFVEKPHVRFDGIYISANTYVHIGEPSVDSFYKPCHLVEYYKYLRFFTDGTVLIYTSADERQSVVQLLHQPPYRDPSVYKGYYRLTGNDIVNVYFTRMSVPSKESRRRRQREKAEVVDQTFFMMLTINSTAKGKNCHLLWNRYTYQIRNRKSGETTDNEIHADSFKPFIFSVVRSYNARSLSPL